MYNLCKFEIAWPIFSTSIFLLHSVNSKYQIIFSKLIAQHYIIAYCILHGVTCSYWYDSRVTNRDENGCNRMRTKTGSPVITGALYVSLKLEKYQVTTLVQVVVFRVVGLMAYEMVTELLGTSLREDISLLMLVETIFLQKMTMYGRSFMS